MRLRSEKITWRMIDGETVLLDLRSSTYLRVNHTGTVLLTQLVDGCSHDELVAALEQAFALPEPQAQADVAAFVDMLDGRGLLEPGDTDAPAASADAP